MKKITLKDLKNHIKKCKRYNKRFDFLGFVENKDLDKEVESMFRLVGSAGDVGYDWIHGNEKLKKLIENI